MSLASTWRQLKRSEPSWYWVCDDAHYGDLYQVFALASAFRDHHGWRHPLRVVASTKSQAAVASVFGSWFDEILIAPAFKGSAEDWRSFFAETGLRAFQLDAPILIWPVRNPRLGIEAWRLTMDEMQAPPTPLHKFILMLPAATEPRPPPVTPGLAAQARQLCEEAGMVQGRSVILCPYARSDPVSALRHFAALAIALKQSGYMVVTSCAGREEPVANTAAVSIPFPLLPEVAGYAGWIVTVRSGIADIVANASCRKTIVYQSFTALVSWNLRALGLATDAREVVFRFDLDSPAEFADLILDQAIDTPCQNRPAPLISPTERRVLFDPASSEGPTIVTLPLVIDAVPSRHNRRALEATRSWLTQIGKVAIASDTRLFACRSRDTTPVFEPVDPTTLVRDAYFNAGCLHTIVVAKSEDMAAMICLPDDTMPLGIEVRLSDACGTPAHRDRLTGLRPLCFRGLLFLQGWSDLEPWGLWTSSCTSLLKVVLSEEAPGDLLITLSAQVAAFTEAVPVVEFQVNVNHVYVGRYALAGSIEPHRIRIEVPKRAVEGLRSLLVALQFPSLKSPRQQDQGVPDDRLIGLGLHAVTIDHAEVTDGATATST